MENTAQHAQHLMPADNDADKRPALCDWLADVVLAAKRAKFSRDECVGLKSVIKGLCNGTLSCDEVHAMSIAIRDGQITRAEAITQLAKPKNDDEQSEGVSA